MTHGLFNSSGFKEFYTNPVIIVQPRPKPEPIRFILDQKMAQFGARNPPSPNGLTVFLLVIKNTII